LLREQRKPNQAKSQIVKKTKTALKERSDQRSRNPNIQGRERETEEQEEAGVWHTMVLAAKQEVLEDLEAGGVVVDGEHAHADGELVPGPMPAVGLPLQLHLLHRHLPRPRLRESDSYARDQETQARAPGSPNSLCVCKGVSFLDPRNPRNCGERRMKPQQGQSRGEQHHESRER